MLSLSTMTTKQVDKNEHRNRVGYARVSSVGQNLDAQIDALKKAHCQKIFTDKVTGSRMDRPGWDSLMEYLRPGDTLVVTELSRMTRSLTHLLATTQKLEAQGIELVCLQESIDTRTVTGRCFLSIMGAIYQMERELRAERASVGRCAAKARGRSGGRPRTSPAKLERARILYENSNETASKICQEVGISRRTLFAYLSQGKQDAAKKQ